MSYSRPIYVQQTGFDTSWSALSKKYSLYLYRDGGIDYRETVNRGGQPVLFIPGHAGSYKQSRSIASETTVQFHELLNHQPGYDYAKLDFFTRMIILTFLVYFGS
jgi:glycosylphosphatidylinositol deacylase